MRIEKIDQPDPQRRKALLEELMKAGDESMNPAPELSDDQKATARQRVSDLRRQCLESGITQREIKAAIEEWEKNKI